MPTTLRARLILATALLLAGASALLLAVLPARLDALSRRWMESRALAVAGLVARSAEPSLDFDDVAAAAAALAPLGDEATYAAVLRADGRRLARKGDLPPDLRGGDPAATEYVRGVLRVRVPIVTRSGARGTVVVGFGLGELEARRHEARRLVGALSVILLGAGLAAAWTFGTALTRPVRRVTDVAQRIAAGEEDAAADLPVAAPGEPGALARSFARMLERLGEQARTIHQMNAQLAARVEERTRELERTNAALQELRHAQEQLVVADRRVAIGRLAAGVGHEINNPLSFVAGNLQWLLEALERERGRAAPEVAPALDEMAGVVRESLAGADRIRRIVQQLRGFSRSGEGEPRAPMRVADAVEAALDMAGHELKHRARVVRDYRADPAVVARPVELTQVFLNLLVNAAQATPPGAAELRTIHVTIAVGADGWTSAAVRDSGTGVPPEVLPRLFEPFFTTKAPGEGTGLGLSVSRGIVRDLGGDILLESAPGAGSTFTVRLPPCAEAPRPPALTPVPATTPPPRPRRILVVDDEPLVLTSISRLLRTWGEIQTASSGSDALERLRRGDQFDLVLCDLMMPDMSGIDLYRKVAAEVPQQARQFVFVTGGASDDAALAFLDRWHGPHLYKPLDLDKLRRVLDERFR